MAYPKWATPDRRHHLVSIFLRSRGFCVFGHPQCSIPEHHYEVYIEGLIADWKADDHQQDTAEWQEERKQLHSLAERRYPLRGQFSIISKDIFFSEQPLYYLLGLGISGLTFKPFAKVRLSSSYVNLFIDLGDTLKRVSKTKRRKAIRYGTALPLEVQKEVEQVIRLAVRHYLNL